MEHFSQGPRNPLFDATMDLDQQNDLSSFTAGESWSRFTSEEPPPPPCFLQKLPMEILTKVCGELADDRSSLARLGRTSRILNLVALSMLYTHLRDGQPQPRRDLALAATLLAYPKLRTAITSIEFAAPYNGPHAAPYSQEIIWDFHRVIQRLFGMVTFQGNSVSAPVKTMAIICLIPNLITLEITLARRWGDTNFLLHKVDNRVAGPKPTCILPSLQNLIVRFPVVEGTGWSDGINLHSLNGLFYCAVNLQSMTIERPRGGTSLTGRRPNVTRLRLIDSFLCYRGLRHVVRRCGDLTHFEFVNYPHGWPENYLPASPAQIVECLLPYSGTLEKLHLAPWVADPSTLEGRPWDLLVRLPNFTALKQVAIDHRALANQIDHRALCQLLWDCPLLEGLSIMGLRGFPTEEFGTFTYAMIKLFKWPRLTKIRLEMARWLPFPARANTELHRHLWGDFNVVRMRRAGVEVVGIGALEERGPFAG
ncbi:hypothetical protein F5144DRAFT_508074 [Chaetomium tenue]|uniref:Uncharacterized protein n=1 Tax=Chaetomium tenue TaxID=1854479 RepID=A0ACB7PCE8_9PEZI|nr:hypothetical protein F5144DRAFT_508074 [Chaetomium globosum]